MKTILLSLSIFILNIHLSTAQTKKIALRSHSGSNASFTIYVPDEFGLGPSDYQLQKLNRNKKCSLNIKPIKPSQIQVKDSMDSIKFCTPLPLVDSSAKHHSTAPKSKLRVKKKKAKKTVKKVTLTTETETEKIASEDQHTKTQVAGFVSTESSESFLILLLSIPALLFFIFTFKKP